MPTNNSAERAVMLAAIHWVDSDGELWPSLTKWSAMSGLTVRGMRGVLRRLTQRGLIVPLTDNRGGACRTVRYRVPALVANPEPGSGFQHGTPAPKTLNAEPKNPERYDQNPGTAFPRTTKINKMNKQEQAAGVDDRFARLGIEHLRHHPNATHDRLAWIERQAPFKKIPGAWAAKCILDGWMVPDPWPADAAVTRKAKREELFAEFDAMPEADRWAVLATARDLYPNLVDHADDSQGVRGAVAKVLEDRALRLSNGGCPIATLEVHSRHGPTDQSDSSGGKGERTDALCDRQGSGHSP